MPFTYREFVILSFFLVLCMFLVTALTFKYVWTGRSTIKSYVINFSITGFTLFYFIFFLEIFFYHFVAVSDNFQSTLASGRWTYKYWNPINSMRYRDIEHPKSQFAGKKVIFVVGDSLAAGLGIKDYRDRFSNVLQDILGGDWSVVNIAQCGWDTANEYKAIRSYPLKPDIIVLSDYVNDIKNAAEKVGINEPIFPDMSHVRSLYLSFVRNSYFINYVYWRIRRHMERDQGEFYWEYLEKLYSNEKVWEAHKKELLHIVRYTQKNDIKLITVLFPILTVVERSKLLLVKVGDIMKHNHIETIDLSTILSGRNPQELIVNSFDFHPSKKLHKEVAGLLFDRIQQQ